MPDESAGRRERYQHYNLPKKDTDIRKVLLSVDEEYMSTNEIGDIAGIGRSAASGSAHNLAKRGFLDKKKVGGKCKYRITDQGKKAVSEMGEEND